MRLSFASRQDWLKSRRQPPSTKLSDYASQNEIANLRAALIERFRSVTGENAEDRRFARGVIRLAIKRIDGNHIPSKADVTEDLLAPIRAKYEAARNNAPEDDEEAAWINELARRRELQEKYGSAA